MNKRQVKKILNKRLHSALFEGVNVYDAWCIGTTVHGVDCWGKLVTAHIEDVSVRFFSVPKRVLKIVCVGSKPQLAD